MISFAQKLDYLLSLTTLNNSKLARELNVDPSLVCRWRKGTRSPLNNPVLMRGIAQVTTGQITTDYQRDLLARLTGHPQTHFNSADDMANTVLDWLKDDSGKAFAPGADIGGFQLPGKKGTRRAGSADITTFDRQENRLLLHQFYSMFNKAPENSILRIYCDEKDKLDFLSLDLLGELVKQNPGFLDPIKEIRFIVNINATTEDIFYILETLLPVIQKGKLQLRRFTQYGTEAFSHSCIILPGVGALLGVSFSASTHVVTVLQTERAVVEQMAVDYDQFYKDCERLHEVATDYPLESTLHETNHVLTTSEDLFFAGNMIPLSIIPPDVLLSMLDKTHQSVSAGSLVAEQVNLIQKDLRHFLLHNKLTLVMPLYTRQEVLEGIVPLAHVPLKYVRRQVMSPELYLRILQNLRTLLEEFENLELVVCERYENNFTVIIQNNYRFEIQQNDPPAGLYFTEKARSVHNLQRYIRGRFHAVEGRADGRDQNLRLLEQHIATLAGE